MDRRALLHSALAGLFAGSLPRLIPPAAAAGALAEWLPRALSAAPDTRRRFVQDRFDLAVLGATACALYGEPGGRP